MLRPIPQRILQSKATFKVPGGVDRYQKPTGETTYVVSKVHLQNDNSTVHTATNEEVTLRGILFVDARLSTPVLDYTALQEAAQAAGSTMTVTVTDKRGRTTPVMSVVTVDALPDDEDNIHHYEIGVI